MTSTAASCASLFPCMFVTHGGGPLPLLGQQPVLVRDLQNMVRALPTKPTAIIVVSAHYISHGEGFSVTAGQSHPLLFDYGGFPAETYKYHYNAPGHPQLAQKISSLLGRAGFQCHLDTKRGWDHGVFVPLMVMFPDADIPVVSLSINHAYNPEMHYNAGLALAPLREEGVLIVASGSSFHNFGYFFAPPGPKKQEGEEKSREWNLFLTQTLSSPDVSVEERVRRLLDWTSAPAALASQPLGEEDHLIPMHVALGAARGAAASAVSCNMMGFDIASFMWTN